MSNDMENWLDNCDLIVEPTMEQIAEVRAIMNSPGMAVIWGMMLATAQTKRVQLENIQLAKAEDATRATLIQGGIKGIYVLRDTLVELAEMGRQPAAPEEQSI